MFLCRLKDLIGLQCRRPVKLGTFERAPVRSCPVSQAPTFSNPIIYGAKFATCRAQEAHVWRIQEIVDGVYEKYKNVDDGEVATYIPELRKADPKHFGICLATMDGHMVRAGDWDKEFTIQSMCKPFASQMALEQFGMEETLNTWVLSPAAMRSTPSSWIRKPRGHSTR